MALTDFLFNGSPPASTTTYGSSTSSLPAWYNDYTQGLISKANAIAATPYQQYQGARIAGFNPQQEQAFSNVNNLAGQYQGGVNSEAFAPAAKTIADAGSNTALGNNAQAQGAYNTALSSQYNPYDVAKGSIQNAITGTNNASGSALGGAGDYLNAQQQFLNPIYQNIQRLGDEKLNQAENGISDRFISGGGFGGSRMGQAIGSARRSSIADIAGQQATLANQGYQQGISSSQSDLARQMQGAAQIGQLGGQQGALAGQTQQNYANIGNQLGQLSQSDLARQLQAGQAQQNLAQTAASTGLQQNAALEAAGSQQQALQQQNLNQAYQDFQNQVNYPSQQASFLNSIIRGLQIPTTQQTSATGPASVYQPSPLSQLAAAGTGFAGLSKALG